MNLKHKFLLFWLLALLLVATGMGGCGTAKKIKSVKTASSDSVAYNKHGTRHDSTAKATAKATSVSAIDSNVASLAGTTVTRRVTFQLDTSKLRPANDFEAAEQRPVSFELDGREYRSSYPVTSVTVEDIESNVSENSTLYSRRDTAASTSSTEVSTSKADTSTSSVSLSKKETSKAKEVERSVPWYWWLVAALFAIGLANRVAKRGFLK